LGEIGISHGEKRRESTKAQEGTGAVREGGRRKKLREGGKTSSRGPIEPVAMISSSGTKGQKKTNNNTVGKKRGAVLCQANRADFQKDGPLAKCEERGLQRKIEPGDPHSNPGKQTLSLILTV